MCVCACACAFVIHMHLPAPIRVRVCMCAHVRASVRDIVTNKNYILQRTWARW